MAARIVAPSKRDRARSSNLSLRGLEFPRPERTDALMSEDQRFLAFSPSDFNLSSEKVLQMVAPTMKESIQDVSSERKAAYYGGTALMAVGFLLFLSTFLNAAGCSGSRSPDIKGLPAEMQKELGRQFGAPNVSMHKPFSAGTAIGGMVLIFIGGFLRSVGAKGLAGSGVILSPPQAREDLKPYAQMAGGMVNDALSQVDLSQVGKPAEASTIVKVKCRQCVALNEEDATFCKQCGAKL